MWVITVFKQDTFRIYEFDNKKDATKALQNMKDPAILSLTNWTLTDVSSQDTRLIS